MAGRKLVGAVRSAAPWSVCVAASVIGFLQAGGAAGATSPAKADLTKRYLAISEKVNNAGTIFVHDAGSMINQKDKG